MVRAGQGSVHADVFEREGVVGIGWHPEGDLTGITSLEAMRARVASAWPNASTMSIANSAGQAFKFREVMQPGDRVVTYDGKRREYLLGRISGNYEFKGSDHPVLNHVRAVNWEGRIPKKALSTASINSLGAILTIFDPGPAVLAELEEALRTGKTERSEPLKQSSPADFTATFAEFVNSYLLTDRGEKHLGAYRESVESGRMNFAAVEAAIAAGQAALKAGKDPTDLILRGLLPHNDTKPHRDGGHWVHVAPAITKDIQSWYEGSGIATAEEWPARAKHIYGFVHAMVTRPRNARELCAAFAESPLGKGLQSGMMTPILNALAPSHFSVVNSKVITTLAEFTNKTYRPTIKTYPDVNEALRSFVTSHAAINEAAVAAGDVDPNVVFDVFAHWNVAVREDDDDDEIGDDDDEPLTSATLDRASSIHARRVFEAACPDAAPRQTATAHFVNLVNFINAAAPGAWSVTLKRKYVRLNVGGIIACDLRREGLYIVVHEPSIPPDVRPTVQAYDQDSNWKYIEGAESYLIPYGKLDPVLSLLKAAQEELVRRTVAKSDKAPFKAAHSPGVIKYLREIGFDVPDPGYALPAAPRVGEGKPIYSAQYSLDDCAADLSLPQELLASWVAAISRKGQAIIYGPPGTGKTFVAQHLAQHLVGGGGGRVELVQFHGAYSYEDFLQGLRPKAATDGSLSFAVVPGRFMEFCTRASESSGLSVLIVDEINRANLSQVFGELMYLLEYRDKSVPLAGGGSFRIPPNVRIIGTMNTADRSIAMVDHALRRRFAFLRLDPQLDVLERYHATHGNDVSGLVDVIRSLNQAIANPSYSLGVSYFLRPTLREDLAAIWAHEIEPYLEEYFFDDPKMVDSFRWPAVAEKAAF